MTLKVFLLFSQLAPFNLFYLLLRVGKIAHVSNAAKHISQVQLKLRQTEKLLGSNFFLNNDITHGHGITQIHLSPLLDVKSVLVSFYHQQLC